MSDIIEKLGITKAPWRVWTLGCDAQIQDSEHLPLYQSMTKNWDDDYLIATAPDMLEALIENRSNSKEAMEEMDKDLPDMEKVYRMLCKISASSEAYSEKATRKSWKEIKGLING